MKQIIYIVAIIISMTSCMKEDLSGTEDIDRSKGIRIYADVLSHTVVETRANGNENTIKDLTILVFDAEDKLAEAVKANIFTNGEIYINLKHTTDSRKIVLMANAQGIIDEATKSGDPFIEGATFGTITEKLILSSSMIVDDNVIGRNIRVLPMLSDIINETKIDFSTSLGTANTPLLLTHRLAKISVESRVSTLKIEAISLRNAPTNGGELLTFNNTTDATPVIAERINYFGTDDAGEGAKFTIGNQPLYLFSSDNTPDTETGLNTVEMIVKAKYDTDAEASYYHIRLDKKANELSDQKTLFDFKPGTHYKVVFTKVTSSGYPTLKEAIDNQYSNLEYQIEDDSNMGEILTNGQYMLNTTNSDCKIYGDYIPDYEYIIADFITNAPPVTKIEITPIGSGFTVVTTPESVVRDGTTITKLKVKLTNQFSSGSVKVRVGNIVKVFTFSIELDPPYIKVDNVLGARIASGFESRTVALSKLAYNEVSIPRDLTNTLEGVNTVYIHFNKITLGDEIRIGEVYYTSKINIHHTKVMVVQRPWVEVSGVKFATGNIVLGSHPEGTERYKIGASVEYGVVFQFGSYRAVLSTRTVDNYFSTGVGGNYYTPGLMGMDLLVSRGDASNWNQFTSLNTGVKQDPCESISTGSFTQWRTPTDVELRKLINNELGVDAGIPPDGLFRFSPTGFLGSKGQLFIIANGRRSHDIGVRMNTEVSVDLWSSRERSSLYMTRAAMHVFTGHQPTYGFSVRCVVGESPAVVQIENFLVAKHDLAPMDWATAMGRSAADNSVVVGPSGGLVTMGNLMTGCRALGPRWRVPYPDELNFIWKNIDNVVAQGGDAFKPAIYWTGREHDHIGSHKIDISGTDGNPLHLKTTKLNVRCVKSI